MGIAKLIRQTNVGRFRNYRNLYLAAYGLSRSPLHGPIEMLIMLARKSKKKINIDVKIVSTDTSDRALSLVSKYLHTSPS